MVVYIWLDADGFVPCGVLEVTERGRQTSSTFRYGNLYLERENRVAIDPIQLPLPRAGSSRSFVTEPDFAVFNGVRDAAPDGWGQHVIQSYAGGRVLTDFDLLAAGGMDRVGALAFGPDLSGPRRWAPWKPGLAEIQTGDIHGETLSMELLLDDIEVLERAQITREADHVNEALKRFIERGSSLGGARPKANVVEQGGSWIAKFSRERDAYSVVRAEWLTMELARTCGLRVPRTKIVQVPGAAENIRDVYMIERFDRHPSKQQGELARTHFVSALTMLGAHEQDRDRWGYADIADAIRIHGSARHVQADMREIWQRMVLNAFVQNEDDHLRNHGFLWDDAGWRLSPLYDVCPLPTHSHDRRLALKVDDQTREATVESLLAASPRFGINREEATGLLQTMARTIVANLAPLTARAGLNQMDTERLKDCFSLARSAAADRAFQPT